MRARLALLSEIPDAWAEACGRWMAASAAALARRRGPTGTPSTCCSRPWSGAWPLTVDRAVAYLEKATREAKVRTSWTDARRGLRRGARRLRGGRARRRRAAGRRRGVRRAARRARPGQRAGPDAAAAHGARACPTSTRAPSCGTSAWSTPTTAARSTSRPAAALLADAWLGVARALRRVAGPDRRGAARSCALIRAALAPAPPAAGAVRRRASRRRTSRWRSPAAPTPSAAPRGGARRPWARRWRWSSPGWCSAWPPRRLGRHDGRPCRRAAGPTC